MIITPSARGDEILSRKGFPRTGRSLKQDRPTPVVNDGALLSPLNDAGCAQCLAQYQKPRAWAHDHEHHL